MDNVVVRSVTAPTEREARDLAVPMLDAFRAAGWELREALWIPGDRRPGLGESLLLSAKSQQLLEAEGTFRITFAHPEPFAIAPSTAPVVRDPDAFEDLGGVRYRRLVPRWLIGAGVAIVGLLIMLSIMGNAGGGLFASAPTPDGGICPVGWIPGMELDPSGNLVPDGTCVRLNVP